MQQWDHDYVVSLHFSTHLTVAHIQTAGCKAATTQHTQTCLCFGFRQTSFWNVTVWLWLFYTNEERGHLQAPAPATTLELEVL